MDMRLVLVTHPNKEHAERITRGVIDAKLAACVLITDVKSFYNWEGKLNEDDEVVTILKTSTDKVTDLEKYIETNHDYDVPAIISFQTNANESYSNWLNDQLIKWKDTQHSVSMVYLNFCDLIGLDLLCFEIVSLRHCRSTMLVHRVALSLNSGWTGVFAGQIVMWLPPQNIDSEPSRSPLTMNFIQRL